MAYSRHYRPRLSAVLVTLLALEPVASGSNSSCGSCSGGRCTPKRAQWQSLLQVKPSVLSQADAEFTTWETAKVEEEPAVPPARNALPLCHISASTKACLPGFMVIGNQKSGTSSLFQILKEHPQIRPAVKKELLWFNGNFENLRCSPPDTAPTTKEFEEYLGFFPTLTQESRLITGEFSASYLHCWCCPAAMKRLMPGLRLIAQLRDPIERARSRWLEQHNWANKTETYGSFEEYVDKELPPLRRCLAEASGSLERKVHCAAQSNILGLSLYGSALKLWLKHYEPADFLVTYLEQFSAHPQAVASAIHSHLGVEDHVYPSELLQKKFNRHGSYGWNVSLLAMDSRRKESRKESANKTALSKLYHFYRPHMKQIKALADKGLVSKLPKTWITRWAL